MKKIVSILLFLSLFSFLAINFTFAVSPSSNMYSDDTDTSYENYSVEGTYFKYTLIDGRSFWCAVDTKTGEYELEYPTKEDAIEASIDHNGYAIKGFDRYFYFEED